MTTSTRKDLSLLPPSFDSISHIKLRFPTQNLPRSNPSVKTGFVATSPFMARSSISASLTRFPACVLSLEKHTQTLSVWFRSNSMWRRSPKTLRTPSGVPLVLNSAVERKSACCQLLAFIYTHLCNSIDTSLRLVKSKTSLSLRNLVSLRVSDVSSELLATKLRKSVDSVMP